MTMVEYVPHVCLNNVSPRSSKGCEPKSTERAERLAVNKAKPCGRRTRKDTVNKKSGRDIPVSSFQTGSSERNYKPSR